MSCVVPAQMQLRRKERVEHSTHVGKKRGKSALWLLNEKKSVKNEGSLHWVEVKKTWIIYGNTM